MANRLHQVIFKYQLTVCALQGLISARWDVVTVEGKIMHELKATALAAQDHYYIARVH